MGKQINVSSFETMKNAAKKLEDISVNYSNISSKLLKNAQTMGVAWDGADNQAFVQQITGFADDLKSMSDKLSTASKALEAQRLNYVNRQDNNITQVQKLQN